MTQFSGEDPKTDANTSAYAIARLEDEVNVCARNITNLQSEVETQNGELDKLKIKVMELSASQIPHACQDILDRNTSAESGVYQIHVHANSRTLALDVYCDMTTLGGGWIVSQRRTDGSENFDRTWIDYKNGFGKLDSEFWLGLEIIYNLVSEGKSEMLINMKDNLVGTKYALYEKFEMGSEGSGYMLTVGNYTGNATDSMAYHNGMKFTTKDRDNDLHTINCAVGNGGWWHNNCYHAALNGPYGLIEWFRVSISIEFVEMKMRKIR